MDGTLCTIDTCSNGECLTAIVDCPPDDACNTWACNADTGQCEATPVNDDTPCDDDLFCNGSETCQGGECVPGEPPCIDDEHCDEDNDRCCECVTDDECDDEVACTTDVCNDSCECVHDRSGCDGQAAMDIKPGSCPNPVNVRKKGVIPIALIGSSGFDVTQVDTSSLVLARADGVGGTLSVARGRRGVRAQIEDVATAFEGELCDCHTLTGDGIDDLSLKFSTQDVVAALDLLNEQNRSFLTLTLSGTLFDGTPFSASDCIRINNSGRRR